MTSPMLRRLELLRGVNAALALCLAAALILLVRPAWQGRERALEDLARAEEAAARQREIAASAPAAEAERAGVLAEVAAREAALAPDGGDMATVRAVAELAGEEVHLKLLLPGEPRPAAAADQPEAARYCELPLRLEAEGAREPLAHFLRALEDEVPGLYLNAVSLHISDSAAGRWNLSVTGWLLLRGPCDGLW